MAKGTGTRTTTPHVGSKDGQLASKQRALKKVLKKQSWLLSILESDEGVDALPAGTMYFYFERRAGGDANDYECRGAYEKGKIVTRPASLWNEPTNEKGMVAEEDTPVNPFVHGRYLEWYYPTPDTLEMDFPGADEVLGSRKSRLFWLLGYVGEDRQYAIHAAYQVPDPLPDVEWRAFKAEYMKVYEALGMREGTALVIPFPPRRGLPREEPTASKVGQRGRS